MKTALVIMVIWAVWILWRIMSSTVKRHLSTDDQLTHEIKLITGKKKTRMEQTHNGYRLNVDDLKYSIISCHYKVAWRFAHCKPDTPNQGFSCTKEVIDGSKESVKSIRERCKSKYGIDIHLELMGKPAAEAPIPQ